MDRRIVPLLAVGYCLAFIDRVNISFAADQLSRDLHFTASIFGAGAGLFFVSYALCEVPSNLLLVRMGARRWLSLIMLGWGLVSVLTLFVRTPIEFCAARLVLGAAEAGFFPGVIYYLTQCYPATHRSSAISRFYLAYPLSSAAMGAVAGYLMNLQGHVGLAGWQWLLLAESLPAILLSCALFLFLPDSPASASWLSQDEKASLASTLAADEMAGSPHQPNTRRATLQPRVWLLGAVLFLLYLGIYGYTFNAPGLVQRATGFHNVGVGWVMAAIGLAGALSMWINGRHADGAGEPIKHVVFPGLLMAAGFVIAGFFSGVWFTLPALLLIFSGYTALQGTFWALPPALLAKSSLAEGIAAINMFAIFGGFCGPFWMGVAKDITGNYQLGLLTLSVPVAAACFLLIFASRYWSINSATDPGGTVDVSNA